MDRKVIAQAVNLMNFLKGPKQFIIPIYRRTYSWTLKECSHLPISLLLTAFGRALLIAETFLLVGFKEAKWKN
ncbi:MAG: hypothetical protein WA610_02260 [Thermodesulfovibrionales bacterium]